MGSTWSLTWKNLVIPVFCHECGRRLLTEENPCFCPDCWERSPRVQRPFCTVCGEPQAGREGFGSLQNFPCHKCRERGARAFGRVYPAAIYAGAVAEAIRLLKFNEKRSLVPALAELMQDFAEREIDVQRYTLVTAVPLHRVRARERGFNQSELLARESLDAFPNARYENVLERVRPTHVQSRLRSPESRNDNVRAAFRVTRPAVVSGQRVLLVDDVVTSGSTVEECCRVLKTAGAAETDVLAVAIPIDTGTGDNP